MAMHTVSMNSVSLLMIEARTGGALCPSTRACCKRTRRVPAIIDLVVDLVPIKLVETARFQNVWESRPDTSGL